MQRTNLVKGIINTLRGRHKIKHKLSDKQIKVREIVMVKGEYKRKDNWMIGIVNKLFVGKHGICANKNS